MTETGEPGGVSSGKLGSGVPNFKIGRQSGVMMATLVDDKEAATVSTDHAFSTLQLTTPEIVEFLKLPLVQGDHRRAFLDLLEGRYGRRFGNPWSFVEYAPAENLELDFTVCAKQPPRETPGPNTER